MAKLPVKLRLAIKRGRLSPGQLNQLIDREAKALGLTRQVALRRASTNTLPTSHIGDDLDLLVRLQSTQRPRK
jgi:hypothetical protein